MTLNDHPVLDAILRLGLACSEWACCAHKHTAARLGRSP